MTPDVLDLSGGLSHSGTLNVNAGTTGVVTFTGTVGAITNPASLTVTGPTNIGGFAARRPATK